MEVIDAHAHFFSRNYFRLLTQQRGDLPNIDEFAADRSREYGFEFPPADPARLADRWAIELERHRITRAVMISGIPGDEVSISRALRVYPQRFLGVAVANPYLPVAEELIEHAAREWGFRGIALYPTLHRFAAHCERLYSIYCLARRYRLVVYIHFGRLRIPPRRWWGLPDVYDRAYADPGDLHQPASDFPSVTFIVPAFGAGTLPQLLRIGLQCPNVCVDTSSSNSWLEDQSEFADLTDVFRRALEVFGPERILFGTDSGVFPRGWRTELFTRQMEIFDTLQVGTRAREAILGGNARTLFGLDRDIPSYMV